jgi:hypothetical protein
MYSYIPHYTTVLDTYKPKRVLEWGPGVNTIMAKNAGCEVWSIEHDKRYMPRFKERHHPILIDLNSDNYITIPNMVDYDLFFVDGRRRAECIESVWQNASVTAICCVHDAQRARYRNAIDLFNYQKFFNDGFCILSKGVKV